MRRSAPLKRRSRADTRADRRARARFWGRVLERADYACLLAGDGPCGGALDAHHIIAKQTLKAHTSTLPVERQREAIWDPRNGVCVCRAHHHRLTGRYERLNKGELPAEAFEFAREWRIEHLLERELAGFRA